MLLGIGSYKDREKHLTRSLEITNTLETMVVEFKKDCIDCTQIVKGYLNEAEDLVAKKGLQISLDMPQTAFIICNKC